MAGLRQDVGLVASFLSRGLDGVESVCGRKAHIGGICGDVGVVAIAIFGGLPCLVRVRVQSASANADANGGNGSGSLPT